MTHICVGNQNIIGSDNGLSPGRRQAIIWTNAGILLIGPLGTNFSEFLIVIHAFSFSKLHLEMASAKWRPFCLDLNVLMYQFRVILRLCIRTSIAIIWNICWTNDVYANSMDEYSRNMQVLSVIWRMMHELLWITIFWTKSRVIIIGKSPHEWPKKSLFTVTNVLFHFSHAILCFVHTKQSSIAHFAIDAKDGIFWINSVTSSQLICDVMRTRGTGIVMSYSSIVLARANWPTDDLH